MTWEGCVIVSNTSVETEFGDNIPKKNMFENKEEDLCMIHTYWLVLLRNKGIIEHTRFIEDHTSHCQVI